MQPKCSSLKSNRFSVNPKLTVFKQTTKRLIHPQKKKAGIALKKLMVNKKCFFQWWRWCSVCYNFEEEKRWGEKWSHCWLVICGILFSLFEVINEMSRQIKASAFCFVFYCIVLIASLLNSNLHTSLHHYRVVRLWSSQHSLSQSHKLSIISEILE